MGNMSNMTNSKVNFKIKTTFKPKEKKAIEVSTIFTIFCQIMPWTFFEYFTVQWSLFLLRSYSDLQSTLHYATTA